MSPSRDPGTPADEEGASVLESLLSASHQLRADELPALVQQHATQLGALDAVTYLVDLQQLELVPFVPADAIQPEDHYVTLSVDATLGGRCFQYSEPLEQPMDDGLERVRLWMPLLDGTERLGVVAFVLEPARLQGEEGVRLRRRLAGLANLLAELVMTKTMYGDSVVRLRRSARMGLAAEVQWSLLPPLTFCHARLDIAAGLEPAYQVAGDSVDYAVDDNVAKVAVFDGMGHGLESARLVSLVVAAYRNARRSRTSLTSCATQIDAAVAMIYGGESFCTGVLAELDDATGELTWVRAGHPPPLLLRGNRVVRELEAEPTLPFGLAQSLRPEDRTVHVASERLQPGDVVVFFSDGVVEARSPEGEMYGGERLADLVVRNLADRLPLPETLRRAVRSLLEHQGGVLDDDATLLLLQWHGDSAQQRDQPGRGAPGLA